MDAIEILTALSTPAGRADPYPLYADAARDRRDDPVLGSGRVLVVGYDAINSVLRDPDSACPTRPGSTRASQAGGSTRCLRPGRGLDLEPEPAPPFADQEH